MSVMSMERAKVLALRENGHGFLDAEKIELRLGLVFALQRLETVEREREQWKNVAAEVERVRLSTRAELTQLQRNASAMREALEGIKNWLKLQLADSVGSPIAYQVYASLIAEIEPVLATDAGKELRKEQG